MLITKPKPYDAALRKAISILLLVAVANLSSSCSYYKVRRVDDPDAAQANSLVRPGKYYILHSGSKSWHLADIVVSEADQTISGRLEELPPQHRHKEDLYHYRRPPESKYRRYKPYRETPSYEVHIYSNQVPDAQTAAVALSSILRIDVNDKAVGHTVLSYTFGTLGIIAGVIVVIGIIALAAKSSCPFAYVQDSTGTWQFNGELYGGAIYAPLERDDYMPLPYPAVTGEGASIKISNELQERQYTNVASLISVTHPAGTSALLDAEGHAHTIAAPCAPLPARAGEKNYSELLSVRDGRSELFDEGNDDEGAVSNAVIRFAKPANAKQGKLVLRAKNSYWLDYAFGKFTECFGTYYNTFAAQQKSVPAATQRAWARAQHIPLSVAIRDRNGWKEVAVIETPGPLAARDYVVPIDLSDAAEGAELAVRLQCGTMFWELDYAVMDYTPDAMLYASAQAPATAIDETGKDVSAMLAVADGQYLAQLSPGTAVTLHYMLPPRAAGMEQSLFLHSRGYYEYIRHYRNMPNVSQLLSFKKDGAFTRFSRERYEHFASRSDLLTTAFKTQ